MFHEIMVLGNLGNDPDLRYTAQGTAVCNMNVATNRKYESNGTMVEETVWFRVATWGKSAEAVSQYLHKGDPVFVTGRLKPDENGHPGVWTKNDGTAAASFEINASTVKFINGVKRGTTVAADDASPLPVSNPPTQVAAKPDSFVV